LKEGDNRDVLRAFQNGNKRKRDTLKPCYFRRYFDKGDVKWG
jgi:hypothetical protein